MVRFAILPALLGLSLTAAAQRAPTCQVTGNIKGLGNQPVVFFYDYHGRPQRDTVRAVRDHFTYAAQPSDDGLINLQFSPQRSTLFWYEPGRVTLTGTFAEPGEVAATGTPENDLFTAYQQRVEWPFQRRRTASPDSIAILDKLMQVPTLAFVRAHPRARTSAHLLYWQTIYDAGPLAEYAQLLAGLAPAVRQSIQGQAAAHRLAILRTQPLVGRLALSFTIPDTAGVAVSLAQFKGQYVLLDFWGHWCNPCIRSMPHVRELRTRYSRQMAVVGIALENKTEKESWLRAIRKNRAYWTQLSELKGAGAQDVIAQYNITAFPTYLLLDKQGVVVARTSDLDDIEAKLKTLLTSP